MSDYVCVVAGWFYKDNYEVGCKYTVASVYGRKNTVSIRGHNTNMLFQDHGNGICGQPIRDEIVAFVSIDSLTDRERFLFELTGSLPKRALDLVYETIQP